MKRLERGKADQAAAEALRLELGMTARPRRTPGARRLEPVTSWGPWALDLEALHLVNRAEGLEVDLGALADCRALWGAVGELLSGRVVAIEPALRGLLELFPTLVVCSRPGLLRPADIRGVLEATLAGTRAVLPAPSVRYLLPLGGRKG